MNRDLLLIGLAAAALMLAWWPVGSTRVTVSIASGNASHRFSLPIDDPRLTKLRKLGQPPSIRCDPELAMARWHHEAASFYAENTRATESESTPFQAVSHLSTHGADPAISSAPAIGHDRVRWSDRAAAAQQRLLEIAREVEERDRRERPRLRIGEPLEQPLPPIAFVVSAGLGIIVAFVFGIWNRTTPPIEVETVHETNPPASHDAGSLRLVVPAAWVQVRQPFAVRLRQGIAVLLIVAAAVSTAVA